jgi:E3 ubiquitin-protein ligase HUWE1
VDKWQAATNYVGYSNSDPVVTWWWEALKSFDQEEKAKVLGFATGWSLITRK